MSARASDAPAGQAPAPDDDVVAAPPPMPIQSALYITPDGNVQFGALFAELLPIAKALDPSLDLGATPPAPKPG